ncbi:MAG: acyltransferase family protein, partial [Clostridiaceae bacterium]|nr:acyltransferase family protein [Clostridiaceae bacterium]
LLLIFDSFIHEKSINESEYLSIETTTSLRGIFALVIVLHHMSEITQGGRLFCLLVHAGYLVVSVFFFFSGYGLMTGLLKKGNEYLSVFWIKRILYIFTIYFIITIMYVAEYSLLGKSYSPLQIFMSFFNGAPIAANSWYMIIQILYYIFFWISFKCCNHRYWLGILILLILQFIQTLILILLQYPAIWYMSGFAFSVGVFWAFKKDEIDQLLTLHFFKIMLIVISLFLIFTGLPLILEYIYEEQGFARICCRILSTSLFSILVAITGRKIRFKFKIWMFLGKISLEIYLIHGGVYQILRSEYCWIENEALWTIMTIIISIVLSMIFNIFFKWIKKYFDDLALACRKC